MFHLLLTPFQHLFEWVIWHIFYTSFCHPDPQKAVSTRNAMLKAAVSQAFFSVFSAIKNGKKVLSGKKSS
jgi:hypothetical protein